MKNKIKSEVLSLVLMMIVNFETGILMYDCYFNPISEYDYLLGSVFCLELICMVTLTCVQKKNIDRLIDKLDEVDEVVVISK